MESKKRIGRPGKYDDAIQALDDDVLYIAATITSHAFEKGIYQKPDDPKAYKDMVTKLRHALSRRAKSHGFPIEGDGMVLIKGKKALPGWFGSRWKSSI